MADDAPLQHALQSLERGEGSAALEHLLEAWRSTRSPAIAEGVARLSARLTQRLPPRGKGASEHRAWLDRAKSLEPEGLGRLLEAIPEAGTSQRVAERLRALLLWPADPRISTTIEGWLKNNAFRGAGRARCFSVALQLLGAQGDPHSTPLLETMASPAQRRATIATVGMHNLKLLRAVAEHLATLPIPAPLSERDTAALVQVCACLDQAPAHSTRLNPEQLLQEIYEHPDDDTRRAVLADLLQERGDPRGEFIALQLARHPSGGAPTRRERELQRSWALEWAGSLGPGLVRSSLEFERGFLSAFRLDGARSHPGAETAPELATVREIDVGRATWFGRPVWPLLLSTQARSLKRVLGAGLYWMPMIERELDWEELMLLQSGNPEPGGPLAKTTALGRLKRLGIFAATAGALNLNERYVETLLNAPIGRSLAQLILGTRAEHFGPLAALAAPRGVALSLSLELGGWRLTFHPKESRLSLENLPPRSRDLEPLALALMSLPKGLAQSPLVFSLERGTELQDGRLVSRNSHCTLAALEKAATARGLDLALAKQSA